jgi:uncharacterized protein (DUF2345 family)
MSAGIQAARNRSFRFSNPTNLAIVSGGKTDVDAAHTLVRQAAVESAWVESCHDARSA